MYLPHPSTQLNKIFSSKPYQGVDPYLAKFLFIGLDANYDPDISMKPIFSKILDYHHDSVAFWQLNKVHHPFLLPEYNGNGKSYHRNFSRIGFRPEHANLLSFVELLHVPTVGRNKLVETDLNVQHLKMLNSAIQEGQSRFIFISDKVHRLMQVSGEFPWLIKRVKECEGPLGILYRQNNKTVFKHLHFSNYGVFAERMAQEAIFIGSLLP
jgi:hypothetical protein